MDEHNACFVTSEPSRVVADAFRPFLLISTFEQLRSELHKSEVLLISTTLFEVKAANIYI